jgi:hypothetical protein
LDFDCLAGWHYKVWSYTIVNPLQKNFFKMSKLPKITPEHLPETGRKTEQNVATASRNDRTEAYGYEIAVNNRRKT